jgi:putative flippase GtrA
MDELENAKDEKGNEKWNFKSRKNKETSELTGLFFSLVDSIRLWDQYLDVIYINATYKVNQFNVLLVSIVGTIGLNTTFYIANIFLVGKSIPDYI